MIAGIHSVKHSAIQAAEKQDRGFDLLKIPESN